jgi:hypothetical protein
LRDLSSGFTSEVDSISKSQWDQILRVFPHANIYQTWSYGATNGGERNLSHLLLKKDGELVAAAQARIVQLPLIKTGIAYVLWGPLWRPVGTPEGVEAFRQALRELRNEFSVRRGLVLRVNPIAYRGVDDAMQQILAEEGYQYHDDGKNHRTLIIDLKPSLEEIRTALDQKWRNCLNRAEKNGLELVAGEEEDLFDEIKKIYFEMARRKGLVDLNNIDSLKRTQRDLPPTLKLKVILCRLNDEFCAGAIFSAIGTMAVYLVGATSDAGMKSKGSYIIQWAFVKWLKDNGFRYYDLNGINPHANPGTYHFKCGLAGRLGRDLEFLGKYQIADNRTSFFVVKGGEWIMGARKRIGRKDGTPKNNSTKELTET